MLDRLELLVGKESVQILRKKTVLIVGVGGVGGYAVEALARSGVGNLILIDPDIVEKSNMNRQLVALTSTVGFDKVKVLKDRIADMGLGTSVTTFKEFVCEENIEDYLENVDFVIDACDTLLTKFAIIKACKKRTIPFISCMGTGNKMDPLKLTITDLSKTSYDPLAKRLRKLVKDANIKGSIMVVSSTEEKRQSETLTIPSNAFVPATAGMLCASYVINQMISG